MPSLHAYTALFLISGAFRVTHATLFNVADIFQGSDFLHSWDWQTFDDPTHGRVDYVGKDEALQSNLSYVSEDDARFVMRADAYSTLDNGGRGRKSVRISSGTSYGESLIILDLAHMPDGCGTWPAFWTLSKRGPWPHGGEIDIVEGVNTNSRNLASCHTTPNCKMVDPRPQSGSTVSTDCDSSVNYNQGCGVAFSQPTSYGKAFNENGGGWFAMSRTANDGVKIWFWPRDCVGVPPEVRDYQGSVDTGAWPQPEAYFPADNCDSRDHFDEHSMTFDLTFCGDWAGTAFGSAGCGPTSCEEYVNKNPSSFLEAYWDIKSLVVYNRDYSPPTHVYSQD